ncbi:GtrA family protein [Litorimonas haliclonae]|uniref:GtrA family protein n=1 Tax=Litorimonas haliclonae TaxID=2081977 RepID=UPI0039EE8A04
MLSSDYREKIVFVMVGGMAALAYYAVYLGLKYVGLATAISLFFAHLTGMVVSYSGHALFTFKKQLANLGQVIRYVVANLFGALVIAIIGHFVWKVIPNEIVILVIATVVATLLNYVLFKYFVYIDET